jgi:tRNA (guanine-N7-)-methyltransferase
MGRGSSVRRKRELEPGPFGQHLEELSKPITGLALFGESAPLELEIGSGKGTFLVGESKRRPETLFLGVEYARRYWLYAADRLRRNDCINARVVLADATELVRDYFEDASLAGVHVYFPDPWPKKRHHKRRLIQEDFVALLARKMSPGARLQIATDHAEYFGQIHGVLERSALDIVAFDPTAAAHEEEAVGSNFERKYRRQGRTLHTIAARKKT